MGASPRFGDTTDHCDSELKEKSSSDSLFGPLLTPTIAGAAMNLGVASSVPPVIGNDAHVSPDAFDYVSNIEQTPIFVLGSFVEPGTARVAYRRIDRTQPQANRSRHRSMTL
jgi:hypothetical protein